MSWLTNNRNNLKNIWKPGLIVLISVFFGCDTAEDAGTEFNLDTNVDVSVIDFTLPKTNLFIDSLRTDSENEILVGRYTDALTGSVEAQGYVQYTYTSGGTLPNDSLSFTSLVLEMEVLDVIGDQSGTIDLEIYELSDTLESVIYLASSSEALEGSPIATVSSALQNIVDDDGQVLKNADSVIRRRIVIGLPAAFGQELYDEMKAIVTANDPVLGSAVFGDLAILPAASSANMVLLSTSSAFSGLTFLMDDADDDSVYSITFPLSGQEYSNVSRDPGASAFSGIIEKQDFDLPDGRAVLDPLAGITTSFSIAGLTDFFDDNDRILINAATFEFGFEDNLPRDTVDLFNLYFRRPDGGFSGAASQLSSLAFGNIVLTDESYILGTNPSLLSAVPGENAYFISPTQLIQLLYNNYKAFGRVAVVTALSEDTVDVSEMVMVSPNDLTLQQTIFTNSDFNLRVFYTEVN